VKIQPSVERFVTHIISVKFVVYISSLILITAMFLFDKLTEPSFQIMFLAVLAYIGAAQVTDRILENKSKPIIETDGDSK